MNKTSQQSYVSKNNLLVVFGADPTDQRMNLLAESRPLIISAQLMGYTNYQLPLPHVSYRCHATPDAGIVILQSTVGARCWWFVYPHNLKKRRLAANSGYFFKRSLNLARKL